MGDSSGVPEGRPDSGTVQYNSGNGQTHDVNLRSKINEQSKAQSGVCKSLASAADILKALKKWKRSVHKYTSCHFLKAFEIYVVLDKDLLGG